MLTQELQKRQAGTVVVGGQKRVDPFVFSPEMIRDLQLMEFAGQVMKMARGMRPALPAPNGGRPETYSDESVLVTLLVMLVWQLSPRAMAKRLKQWPALALACGYKRDETISASQLYRRRDRLGNWGYFLTFVALVWVLISRGVIVGRDWVIDSTIIDAFTGKDSQAGWSFTRRFGYKVHLLICRDSLLPLMVLVSPANRHDAPWAVPLMALTHALFRLPVQVVRADAAYFTRPVLTFITLILHATPKVVFNARKARKKFLVTLFWVAQARADKGKRGYIERLFAVLKRYFGLNSLRTQGYTLAFRHALEICCSVLLLAWLADSLGRPDLSHARSRLLAPC
jgi:hypothetical protein